MKSFIYILAVIAIAAAAFFGWQVKDKTEVQLEALADVKGQTSNIDQSITKKEAEEAEVKAAKNEVRSQKDEVVARLQAAEGKKGDLQKTFDRESTLLEEQEARIAELDKLMAELRSQVGNDEIALDEIPSIVENLESDKKSKDKQLSELELIREKLSRTVAEAKAEIVRVGSKISESKARVRGNTFRATVSSVNNEWGFLVIAAGEKSGLSGDSKLLLVREGRLIGKLALSSLEANQAIAEVIPGSMATGVRPSRGDSVILTDTASN